MAKYRLDIKLSNNTTKPVEFTLPKTKGKYNLDLCLSNDEVLNAGEIEVNGFVNTYKLDLTLSNGRTIDCGVFSTEAIVVIMSNIFIGGNWKMNKVKAEIDAWFESFLSAYIPSNERMVILFPPACYLQYCKEKIDAAGVSSSFKIGIQNIAIMDSSTGAFTGQISPEMAADCGCEVVMVGNSECRYYLGVTEETCGTQMKRAMQTGLTAWLCVGDPLEEREAGNSTTYLNNQLQAATAYLSNEDFSNGKVVIVYEPVWAIGTGKTCSAEQAQQMCMTIRTLLADMGISEVERLPILYGGTSNPNNIETILSQADIKGVLAGGVAMQGARFAEMINKI